MLAAITNPQPRHFRLELAIVFVSLAVVILLLEVISRLAARSHPQLVR